MHQYTERRTRPRRRDLSATERKQSRGARAERGERDTSGHGKKYSSSVTREVWLSVSKERTMIG
jgi:hypothetical protein